jgi:hypothetical protein
MVIFHSYVSLPEGTVHNTQIPGPFHWKAVRIGCLGQSSRFGREVVDGLLATRPPGGAVARWMHSTTWQHGDGRLGDSRGVNIYITRTQPN